MAEDTDGQPAYSQRAIGRFSQELQRAEQEYQAFLDDHASRPRLVNAGRQRAERR